MSLHRVRLIYSEAGASSFNNWLETWLINMQPWEAHENTVPTLNDGPFTDTPHYRGDLIFSWSKDKSIIEDQLNGYISSYCDWAIVAYHVCDHDEENSSHCYWNEPTYHPNEGSIPTDVSL